MKQCTLCKVDLNEDNKHKRYARCVSCVAEVAKKANAIYREDNKEELAEKHKKYITENKEKIKITKKKYLDSHKPEQIIAQQKYRLRASGITDMQIAIVNAKWDKWYPNYVIYRKSKNENFEYSMSLTVLKKRQIMGDWLKNEKMDFSVI